MTGTADTEARGVQQDLQPRRHRHPDRTGVLKPHRRAGPRLPDRAREVRRDRRRTSSTNRRTDGRRWSAPVSIEKVEKLSTLLTRSLRKRGHRRHVVLNAKYHAQEAEIVAQAGRKDRRHDRHEHGGPRHRHSAWRQRRAHGARSSALGGEIAQKVPEGRRERYRRRRAVRLLLPSSISFYRVPQRRLGAHLRSTSVKPL